MAKVTKSGQVGNRMTEAQKASANALRNEAAIKKAAKAATKTKAAKAVKSVFRKTQAMKIALLVFIAIIPTDLVEPTWDNLHQFDQVDTNFTADKQVAPVVKAKVTKVVTKPVTNRNLTGTKADKFAPSAPSATILAALPVDANECLIGALKKAMYDSFYQQQQEAVDELVYSRKSEIHAAYMSQYDSYKANISSVVSIVTGEMESIKAQAIADLSVKADKEIKAYEQELKAKFECDKPLLIEEALSESIVLPQDISVELITKLMIDAKKAEQVLVATKKEAAINKYNQQQASIKTTTLVDSNKSSLAKAKAISKYANHHATAMACRAVVTNCSAVTKLNKEQANKFLNAFVKLQAAVKLAEAAIGQNNFTKLLDAVYAAGKALLVVFNELYQALGYSIADAVENILEANRQDLNTVEDKGVLLTEKQKDSRRVILKALDLLECN